MSETLDGKPDLLVIGVHKALEGYPNVLYRLGDLRASGLFSVSEINIPIWRKEISGMGLFRLAAMLLNAISAHATLLFRYMKRPTPQRVYVPYPAITVLSLLSLLPQRYRPRHVVADAFISIYDTVVNDRQLLGKNNLLARFLHLIERRAYSFADVVVVDTPENAEYLREEFGLPSDKFRPVPLSTNELHFRPNAYQPRSGAIRILFVGTLIPLHGIETILKAAEQLKDRKNITFHLIGDGQQASVVEQFMHNNEMKNLVWKRDWQTPGVIAEEIEKADICLGIFGDTAKAQRVCPLKLYAYAAIGRPIITGQTEWLRNATAGLSYSPFASIPVSDSKALERQILALGEDPALRLRLAENSLHFYETKLCNQIAYERFMECLSPVRA